MSQLTVNGVRHHFRLEGAPHHPQKIVLIHSVGSDLSVWDKLSVPLAQHCQVLRYDIRGHGGSAAPDGDYTLPMLADDLLELTLALGWEHFSVGGVSIGGMLALHMAAHYPNKVGKLLLASTAPKIPIPAEEWNLRIQRARAHGMADFAATMAERMFTPEYRQQRPADVDSLNTVMALMDPIGYAGSLAVLRDTDLSPLLSRILVPVLLVTGRQDGLMAAEAIQTMAALLPEFSHRELDSGHYPMVEHPAEFNAWAQAFFGAPSA